MGGGGAGGAAGVAGVLFRGNGRTTATGEAETDGVEDAAPFVGGAGLPSCDGPCDPKRSPRLLAPLLRSPPSRPLPTMPPPRPPPPLRPPRVLASLPLSA